MKKIMFLVFLMGLSLIFVEALVKQPNNVIGEHFAQLPDMMKFMFLGWYYWCLIVGCIVGACAIDREGKKGEQS